jgi:hypothetical protein
MRLPPFFYEFPHSNPSEVAEEILRLIPVEHLFHEHGTHLEPDEVLSLASKVEPDRAMLTVILADSRPLKGGVMLRISQPKGDTTAIFEPWSSVNFCRWITANTPSLVSLAEKAHLTIFLGMLDDRCRDSVRDHFKGIPNCELVE